jgi:Peptidase family M48
VSTRPIDEIRVTPGCDLAVYEKGGFREKMQDRAKRILILGVGALNGMRQNAFRAVLAHEYGHFSHRDTAGGDVALRVDREPRKTSLACFI